MREAVRVAGSAARLELVLLDPQVAREFGIVSANLLEKPLGVLATDKYLDRVSERVIKAASLVADDVDEHRDHDDSAASFVA